MLCTKLFHQFEYVACSVIIARPDSGLGMTGPLNINVYGAWRSSGGGAYYTEVKNMKEGIHPKYEDITVTCSCGNKIQTRSTLASDMHIDVCSQCHPFYTGKQKVAEVGGRIDRFNKRFGNRSK